MHPEYPKWRYHATEKPFIVRDCAHEDEAAHRDAGWVDHPSQIVAEPDLPAQVPAAKVKTKGKK
jgi:hypothetical protein